MSMTERCAFARNTLSLTLSREREREGVRARQGAKQAKKKTG